MVLLNGGSTRPGNKENIQKYIKYNEYQEIWPPPAPEPDLDPEAHAAAAKYRQDLLEGNIIHNQYANDIKNTGIYKIIRDLEKLDLDGLIKKAWSLGFTDEQIRSVHDKAGPSIDSKTQAILDKVLVQSKIKNIDILKDIIECIKDEKCKSEHDLTKYWGVADKLINEQLEAVKLIKVN